MEIVGVDGPLPRRWSSRRAAIDLRRAVLAAQFQTDHGRPPAAKEAVALAEQANKETRQRKHEPRSFAAQRAAWRTEALAVLDGETGLRDYLRRILTPSHQRRTGPTATDQWIVETADPGADHPAVRPRRVAAAPRTGRGRTPSPAGRHPARRTRPGRHRRPRQGAVTRDVDRTGHARIRHGRGRRTRRRAGRAAPLGRHVGLRGGRLDAVHVGCGLGRRASDPRRRRPPRRTCRGQRDRRRSTAHQQPSTCPRSFMPAPFCSRRFSWRGRCAPSRRSPGRTRVRASRRLGGWWRRS
jgi:hypothetical protein